MSHNDFAGRRVKKQVGTDPAVITKYVYDGDQVIAEYEGSTLKRKFIYGPGIDEPIMIVNRIQSTGRPTAETEYRYYYHYDGLGSVVALTNSAGNIVEQYSYDVYGKPTIRDANDEIRDTSSVANPYMFTARRFDGETQLYYYRARYYNPEIGRFLQTDPIGYYDSMNLYQYCWNNPINWVDPDGLKIVYSDKDSKIKEDLDSLKEKSEIMREIINALEKSKLVFKIRTTERKGPRANKYSSRSRTVRYNPNVDHIYDGSEDWMNIPAEVILAHELIHAYHHLNGELMKNRMQEEHRTVGLGKYRKEQHTENRVRKEYGLKRRPRY